MKWLAYLKYIPWVILLLVCLYGVYHYWNHGRQLEKLLATQQSELMRSNLDLGRAQTSLGSVQEYVKTLEKKVREEIKARGATLTLYAEISAKNRVLESKKRTSVKVVYRDREVDLPPGKLCIRTDEKTYEQVQSLPYHYSDFRITLDGDAVKGLLSYQMHQKFKLIFAETRLPNGAINHYANLYELDGEGKQVVKLALDSFVVVRAPELPPHMMWWNPKLDLMLGGGITHTLEGNWTTDIGISISAWGRTSDDISWRFFRVGLGITGRDGLSASFSPVQYNVAKKLPLVSNLWITPFAGYDFINQFAHFGAAISVVF